ncbi:hypothetical protein [Falsiroseomonas sp.]|uniref:hypothetical protein n=1 Tax=Falsiroseomonas sp. TaxID=2870721 RepID=UPI00356722A4
MRSLTVLFVVAALLTPCSARAQRIVDGVLVLDSKPVPLPGGPWRVLHLAAEPGRSREGSLPTTTHRAVLVQEHGGRAAAVVIASAATEVGAVWNPHGICTNPAAIQRENVQALRGLLDCRGLVVIGSGRGPNTPAYLDSLYDEGQRRPGWIPPNWLSAQFVLSEGMHYLIVEYRFAPGVFAPAAARGETWNEGARSPAREELVQRLAAFSAEARNALRQTLHGRAPSAPLPFPF